MLVKIGSGTARYSRLMFHGVTAANAAMFAFKQGPCVDRCRCVSKHLLALPPAINCIKFTLANHCKHRHGEEAMFDFVFFSSKVHVASY